VAPRARVARFPQILVRSRGAVDRLGLAFGLNGQPAIDDTEFEARVYVESDAAESELAALLGSPATRSAILALLGVQGVSAVLFNERGALAALAVDGRAPAKLVAQLDALVALAATLPLPAEPLPPRLVRNVRAEVFAVVGIVLFAWLPPVYLLERFAPYRGDFGLSVAGWALALLAPFLVVQWRRSRRRPTGLRRMTASLVAGAIGSLSLVASLVVVLNAMLPSERHVRAAQIEDWTCWKSSSGGKMQTRRTDCKLAIRTLDDRELHEVLRTERWTFEHDDAIAGRCGPAELVEREGALGFALLERVRRLPNGPEYFTACASER
jgi:hypothetical protein